VCVLDEAGARIFEGKATTDPAVLARLIRKRAPDVGRVGLESRPTSAWHFHALTSAGLPTVCLDARYAQEALSVRPNKSHPSDARGLAEMVRMGWFRAVKGKSATSHERKALLISWHQFVEMRVRTDNQQRRTDISRANWIWPAGYPSAGTLSCVAASMRRRACC
jgi:transposase